MTHLELFLKIVLCAAAFVTAFLGIFKKTIDDNGRLTNYGKTCVACVCLTFCLGVGNEVLNLSKEAESSAEKKAANDRVLVMQGKLDQASEDGKKRWKETKAYMIEAENARKRLSTLQEKLSALQEKLSAINERVSDPTLSRMILDVKRLAGDDINLTKERLSVVISAISEVNSSLGEARVVLDENKNNSQKIKNDMDSIMSDINTIKLEMGQIKSAVTAPTPTVELEGADSGDGLDAALSRLDAE
jgi:septal ring factor EnvC (AmiA/AmiB activator)